MCSSWCWPGLADRRRPPTMKAARSVYTAGSRAPRAWRHACSGGISCSCLRPSACVAAALPSICRAFACRKRRAIRPWSATRAASGADLDIPITIAWRDRAITSICSTGSCTPTTTGPRPLMGSTIMRAIGKGCSSFSGWRGASRRTTGLHLLSRAQLAHHQALAPLRCHAVGRSPQRIRGCWLSC